MGTVTTPVPQTGRADIAALQDLLVESRQLRADMRAAETQQKFRFRLTLIFITVMTAAVGGLATLVFQNQRISAQIADCTNQGGGCWEESRHRSKTNVTSILNTTIFVAECLNRYPEQPRMQSALEACIRRELATGRQPVPVPTPTRAAPSPPSSGSSR